MNLQVISDYVLEHKSLGRVRIAPVVCAVSMNDSQQRFIFFDFEARALCLVSAWRSDQPRRKILIHLLKLDGFYDDCKVLRSVAVEVSHEKVGVVIWIEYGGALKDLFYFLLNLDLLRSRSSSQPHRRFRSWLIVWRRCFYRCS